MAAHVIDENEFSTWLTPGQAREILSNALGHDQIVAMDTIVRRLANGLIKSAAENATVTRDGQASHGQKFEVIPPEDWKQYSFEATFWRFGDLTINHHGRYGVIASTNYFNVRFEPHSVRAILAPTATPAADERESETPSPPTEERGPRVSGAHLQAWYDLYRRVYPGDTPEPHAVRSAQGMFPDKSVARDRVRALRGPQKRGRKPTDED